MSIISNSLKNDFEVFKKHYYDFLNGFSDELKFKTIRVPFGIYEQRESNTYMARVKLHGGVITPKQLLELSYLSQKYANSTLHITTRGGVQLHYVKIENFLHIIETLHKIGLTSRGGGGNTVRNITSDAYAGIAKDEIFDVTPYVIALSLKMLDKKDSYSLPRKYKIAFSSSSADRGGATFVDVGFIAKIKGGKRGFSVFIAGGMGAKSKIGHLFIDFLPENEIFLLSQAIKEVFDENGNRKNKNAARLRFLFEELGEEKFRKLVNIKMEKLKNEGDWQIELKESSQVAPLKNSTILHLNDEERLWWNRYVYEQKQNGYFCAKIPLFFGDLSAQNAEKLALELEKIADNRDVMRFGSDQNIYIRNLKAKELLSLYPLLKDISPLSAKPSIFGDSVVCTGAATCQLGITVPRGAMQVIEKKLMESDLNLDELKGFKIHMSGCPNSCGKHAVADLGFFGKVLREGSNPYPAYNILAGAKIGKNFTRFGKKIADISAYHLPSFTVELLRFWIEIKKEYNDFSDWIDDKGEQKILELAQKYSHVPSFDEDKNPYYDYSGKDIFSLKGRGTGECSAGMYDLIEADKKALNAALKGELNDENLTNIRLLAARMLLITRGDEARSEKEVLEAFKKHFIKTDLISKSFSPSLEGKATKDAVNLANAVIRLYGTMDNSLRFAAESQKKQNALENETKNAKNAQNSDKFKDYRGVMCPMNFVKTKMDLAQMQSGEILDILLDGGAPIDNVPRSVASEGHTILEQIEQKDGHWLVRIRKK
ncbi:MAG: sulfurtransferase TusA family protein [Campylobacteraceae bacterium]|jgi:sulfite reductase (ferredoxin)|nr:sulfurtransferase TusA family protein [Campylobacteraceae bacterium]